MTIQTDENLQLYIEESLEHLADIENDLLAIEEAGAHAEQHVGARANARERATVGFDASGGRRQASGRCVPCRAGDGMPRPERDYGEASSGLSGWGCRETWTRIPKYG